jgi:hypothetical protein
LNNNRLGADFLITSKLKNFIIKLGQIFDEVAKLGKSNQDTYNWGGWLSLYALLKNGVAEGVASDPHDTTFEAASSNL